VHANPLDDRIMIEGLPNRRRRAGGPQETDLSVLPYFDDSADELDDKDRRSHYDRMFGDACAMGQLILNPCLFFHLCVQKLFRNQTFRDFMRSRATRTLFSVVAVVLMLFVTGEEYNAFRVHPLRPTNDWEVNHLPIQISYFDFSSVDDIGGWTYPRRDQVFPSFARMHKLMLKERIADFGGLIIHPRRESSRFEIQIDPRDDIKYEAERMQQIEDMNSFDMKPLYWHDDELDHVVCHRPNWRSLYFPNCNNFHETDLSRDFEAGFESKIEQNYDSYRFNNGFYREAWLVNDVERSEAIVLKTLRGVHDFTARVMLMVQRDAIIMERLTSSPRIINMYGHCGTSITVEPISYELELYVVPNGYKKKGELGDQYEVKPQNDFQPIEKLEMALDMAESLAVLHGYEGGVIVHDDVQLCQWLRTKRGTLVLGDFNRAEIMNWDHEKEAYCRYSNGLSYGNWRSPEEFKGKELNEKIDIFSLGNNLYGLLTGLWVYYENEDDTVVQKAVVAGSRAFIDERYRTRSFAERKLVEAIEKCWEYDPDKRINIFALIKFLRGALDYVKVRNESDMGNAHYPNQGGDGDHRDQPREGLELSKD